MPPILDKRRFLIRSLYCFDNYCRYYDFKDKKLALRNIWLRQRDSTWELKSGNNPKVDPDHLEGLGTTYYM